MNNNSTNNSINGIRAKKISQLDNLPESFYPTDDNSNEDKLKNLYFVLGFNGENERISNYRMNFEELINLLVRTGKISGTSNTYTVSYNLEHISTDAPTEFNDNVFEINLTPDIGYNLPDEIIVIGSSNYIYNKNTGCIQINTSKKINFITIEAIGIPIEYTFGITTSNMSVENLSNLTNKTYHIGDIINFIIYANDEYNYDAPNKEEISLSGLNILNYEKLDDKASISLEINGLSRYTNIEINAKKILNYYFGYSIKNDTILNYNEDGLPYEAGTNFANILIRGRNICPIPFIDGFDYENGISNNENVFIIVPQKYYNINKNLYIDDDWNGYKLQSGTFAIEIPVQTEPNSIASPMIYNFIYNDVAYYALCISWEGKHSHQSFIPFGSISEYVYKIEWNTQLDNNIVIEGRTISSENDSITVYRLDGSTDILNLGFTIEIEPKEGGIILGSYENGVYTAPEYIEDTTYVSLICKYISNNETFESRITLTIIKAGIDEDLCGIIWDLNIDQINSLDTFAIDLNRIYGKFGIPEDYTTGKIDQPELVTFEIISGGGQIDNYQYTAPRTRDNITVKLKATYKGYENIVSITIKGIGFDSLLWDTDLPKAIYGGLEGEQLDIDTTLYKVIGTTNAIMELIEDENNISLVSSMEHLSNKIFIPNEVNSDTEVKFTISYNGFTIDKFVIVKPSDIPILEYSYWYIGQYEPTGYTNPENDLIDSSDSNDKTGWRKIEESYTAYKTNPLYSCPANETDRISFHDDATYFVVIPSGFLFKDILGETILIDIYNTITIGNRQYNVYKFDTSIEDYDETFIYNIYYTNTSPYYIYWGSTLPTSDTNPEDNLSQSFIKYEMVNYGAGWCPIGESIDIYTNGDPYISDTFSNNSSAGENVQCNYVLIPKGLYLIDGFNIQLTSKDGDSILDCNIGTSLKLSSRLD